MASFLYAFKVSQKCMDIHSEDERKGERELHIAEDRSDLTE